MFVAALIVVMLLIPIGLGCASASLWWAGIASDLDSHQIEYIR